MVVERDASELVAADGRVVHRLALVGHIAQHVPVLVLRPRLAEVQADRPVEERQVVIAVAVGVERRDAHEATAVEEYLHGVVELGGEAVEREVVAAELQRIGLLCFAVASAAWSSAWSASVSRSVQASWSATSAALHSAAGFQLVQEARSSRHVRLLSCRSTPVARTSRPGVRPSAHRLGT